MTAVSPVIEFKKVSKTFGSVKANRDVSFSVHAGEVHAIVGENGAGKSTLMKILFGLYRADQGEVFLRGAPANIKNPADSKSAGIGMVHQHFMLAGPLTGLDHVILDTDHSPLLKTLPRQSVLQTLEKISADLQMPVPWTLPVEQLPVGIQQRIEILKLLYLQSEILIFDEPTAVLTPQETEEFLKRLLQLKAQGKTIILITHKLKEVFAVADSITVFRHGTVVGTAPSKNWNLSSLSEAMVGEPLRSSEFQSRPPEFQGTSSLKVKNLFGKINFHIEKGEVVGIAGVEGNGQSELIQALLNPRSLKTIEGQCLLENDELLTKTNAQIRQSGVGYLAEDRHSKGILLNASLDENFMLGTQDLWTHKGLLKMEEAEQALKKAVTEFDIKIGSTKDKISSLSGGNQQKLVVARELVRPLKLLVAAQPTRGVDIGAIEKIHQTLWNLRKKGTAILLISSELDELMKLSDRILVLYRGEFLGEFTRAAFDEKKIGAVMGGIKP